MAVTTAPGSSGGLAGFFKFAERGTNIGTEVRAGVTTFLVMWGLTAITDVSIDVGQGEVVAIIGPNGAGKTSLLRAISGLVRPASGEIWLAGQRISTQRRPVTF